MNARGSLALLAAGLLAELACACSSRPKGKGELLLAAIDARGPRAVIDSLWRGEHPNGLDEVSDSIATGAATWLEVGRRLRAESDAGVTEELLIDMSYALQRAPERVLPLLGPRFPLAEVCSGPFYDTTPEFEKRFLDTVIASLETVRTPELIPARDSCLREFRRELEHVRHQDSGDTVK